MNQAYTESCNTDCQSPRKLLISPTAMQICTVQCMVAPTGNTVTYGQQQQCQQRKGCQ